MARKPSPTAPRPPKPSRQAAPRPPAAIHPFGDGEGLDWVDPLTQPRLVFSRRPGEPERSEWAWCRSTLWVGSTLVRALWGIGFQILRIQSTHITRASVPSVMIALCFSVSSCDLIYGLLIEEPTDVYITKFDLSIVESLPDSEKLALQKAYDGRAQDGDFPIPIYQYEYNREDMDILIESSTFLKLSFKMNSEFWREDVVDEQSMRVSAHFCRGGVEAIAFDYIFRAAPHSLESSVLEESYHFYIVAANKTLDESILQLMNLAQQDVCIWAYPQDKSRNRYHVNVRIPLKDLKLFFDS